MSKTRPARLLLLTHSYWPEHSPPQRRWSSLIRELILRGWQVDVVAPIAHFPTGRRNRAHENAGQAWRAQTGPYGERIRRVPFLPHDGHSKIFKLIDQILSAVMSIGYALFLRKPAVVVATAPSLPTLGAGYVVARFKRAPLLVEMRDAWPDLARDARLVQGQVKSLVERVVEFVQHRADLVVTVTEGFATTLRERGVKNVETVSNGLDVHTIPFLAKPPEQREKFRALYLGNHGESQRLDVLIRAAAMVGTSMELVLVGHGTQRRKLMALARELGAPVTFMDTLHGPEVLEQYELADTCVVSLRDDWKSFETTVPSKTYEVLSLGRHITAVVRGEAARVIEKAQVGDVMPSDPQAIAELWRCLAADRRRLVVTDSGRQWVEENADYAHLAAQYSLLLSQLAGCSSRVGVQS